MIKLLVFDFDGTICDTAPGIAAALNTLLGRHGAPPVTAKQTETLIGTGLKGLAENLNAATGGKIGDLQTFEKDFINAYRNFYLQHSKFYAGFLNFLEGWKGKVSIISNKHEEFVHGFVKASPLRNFEWQTLYGGDSLPTKKPHPGPLLNTMSKAQVEPHETVMVGDGHPDIKSAKAAGTWSVAIDFGYSPIQELIDLGADRVLKNYDDLQNVIKSLQK